MKKKLLLMTFVALNTLSTFTMLNEVHSRASEVIYIEPLSINDCNSNFNNNHNESIVAVLDEINHENKSVSDVSKKSKTKLMYSNCEAAIHKYPVTDYYIYDYSLVNTSFEVIEEKDGWCEITTDSGYAFIQSKFLSEHPIRTYTNEELEIMAHLLAGEAQCYDDMEQRYVGSVALNRINHSAFPNTLKEVVFQKGQYACTWDGNYYREPTESNWNNAKWLLENGSILPDHVIYQSGGKQGSGVYLKTKWHHYCY